MSAEKVLRDPIKPSKRVDGRTEWSFKGPCYDNRTSGSIPAGNDYGVGFKTPVGMKKPGSMASGPIPQSSTKFSPDKIFGAMTGSILRDGGEDQKG